MKKVVVAEASPTIKSVADSLLRQSGYDVVCTSDGLQAWEVIASERPDLVLVGLGLSGISGLDLCRQMAADRITGGIPLVLMIGARDPISEEEIVASGARGKLRKPFSPKDLLDIVEKLVGKASKSGLRNDPSGANQTDATVYKAQVSSTGHLNPKNETYNLEWLDLSDRNQNTTTRVASLDLAAEDQGLVIEDDQYGLSNPMLPEEKTSTPEQKDEDYEWFIGEIKREIENKPKPEITPSRKDIAPETPSFGIKAGDEIKFDDLRPAEPGVQSSDEPTISWGIPPTQISQTSLGAAPLRIEPPPQSLSDDEIEALSERIAIKLASHIIANLDKERIIEAIKAALKG